MLNTQLTVVTTKHVGWNQMLGECSLSVGLHASLVGPFICQANTNEADPAALFVSCLHSHTAKNDCLFQYMNSESDFLIPVLVRTIDKFCQQVKPQHKALA